MNGRDANRMFWNVLDGDATFEVYILGCKVQDLGFRVLGGATGIARIRGGTPPLSYNITHKYMNMISYIYIHIHVHVYIYIYISHICIRICNIIYICIYGGTCWKSADSRRTAGSEGFRKSACSNRLWKSFRVYS